MNTDPDIRKDRFLLQWLLGVHRHCWSGADLLSQWTRRNLHR